MDGQPQVGEVRTVGDESRVWTGQGWLLMQGGNTAPAKPAAPVEDTNPLANAGEAVAGAIGSGVQNLATGVVKGVGNMALGAGDMINKIPFAQKLVDKMYGVPGISQASFDAAHKLAEPDGFMQHVGKFGADVASMALAPEVGVGSIPARAGANALIAGTQTKGSVPAMIASGGLTAAADKIIPAVTAGAADKLRGMVGREVAGPRTAAAAKAAGESMDDPMWIAAREHNSQAGAALIEKFGLTGNPAHDLPIIHSAGGTKQEVLSSLSNALNPANRKFNHAWSLATIGSALPAMAFGQPAFGLAPVGLAALGAAQKYPGATAAGLDAMAGPLTHAGEAIGGLTGKVMDPIAQALMNRGR